MGCTFSSFFLLSYSKTKQSLIQHLLLCLTLTFSLRASGAVHLMGNFIPVWLKSPNLARPKSDTCQTDKQSFNDTWHVGKFNFKKSQNLARPKSDTCQTNRHSMIHDVWESLTCRSPNLARPKSDTCQTDKLSFNDTCVGKFNLLKSPNLARPKYPNVVRPEFSLTNKPFINKSNITKSEVKLVPTGSVQNQNWNTVDVQPTTDHKACMNYSACFFVTTKKHVIHNTGMFQGTKWLSYHEQAHSIIIVFIKK